MSDFPVTVFHNPKCGTSRNALAIVRAAGYEPEVVEYVKAGWTAEQLKALLERMGAGPRAVLRTKGAPEEALAKVAEGVSDDALIAAMVEHPILVERPIVASPKGVVLARPSEQVVSVLERKPESFTKEDGTVVPL
ncbi:arsenate reductase (glutaredoxin) [Caulobacter sp. 17J65-9]|uniref:arsenate reductase (glutaredoxin) n=1 Tax=Caulobacter sp. 17J65-9 TaxID=2709382 RepID=UPI003204D064